MRQISGLTVLRSRAHFPIVSPRRFSLQQRIGIISSNASSSPITIPSKAYVRPARLREGQFKRLSSLACQAEGLQSVADIQAFTDWLIENGGKGIHGDTQKVEIYQYGEDGRGLRATMVLPHHCGLEPRSTCRLAAGMPTYKLNRPAQRQDVKEKSRYPGLHEREHHQTPCRHSASAAAIQYTQCTASCAGCPGGGPHPQHANGPSSGSQVQ